MSEIRHRYLLVREQECGHCAAGRLPSRLGGGIELTCPVCRGTGWWDRRKVPLSEALTQDPTTLAALAALVVDLLREEKVEGAE